MPGRDRLKQMTADALNAIDDAQAVIGPSSTATSSSRTA